jgi:hypothetical protein
VVCHRGGVAVLAHGDPRSLTLPISGATRGGPSCGSGRPVRVPDVVHELLATERALKKLGAGSILAGELAQLLRNPHATIRNPRGPKRRRLFVGRNRWRSGSDARDRADSRPDDLAHRDGLECNSRGA